MGISNGFKVFIDESGNSGEVNINKYIDDVFSGQPVFVLGAIGLFEEEIEDLERYVESLKKRHNVQSDELKSKRIYERKPQFISDLLNFLLDHDIPVFVELMDKKYYLSIQITETLLFARIDVPIDIGIIKFRTICADYFYFHLQHKQYELFCNACRQSTHESFKLYLDSIYELLLCKKDKYGMSLLKLVRQIVLEYQDYLIDKKLSKPAHEYFLPLQDMNDRNEFVRLLPNINAYAAMIARAEKYRDLNDIEQMEIIHDEQKQFEKILLINANILRSTGMSIDKALVGSNLNKHFKYSISDNVTYSFEDSKKNIGIQVADLIAGSAMRIWDEFIRGKEISNLNMQIIDLIISFNKISKPLGVNFVVSDVMLDKFRSL